MKNSQNATIVGDDNICQQLQKFGYECFGPFLLGFVNWLYKQITDKGNQKVLFFSRDGYMMQKAFDIISNGNIQSEYVYFSRNSIRRPLLADVSNFHEAFTIVAHTCQMLPVSELFASLGLTHKDVNGYLQNNGLKWTDILPLSTIENNAVIQKVFDETKQLILSRSAEQKQLLLEYCNQIGLDDSCSIVDIGWRGTMQANLEKLLSKQLSGLYVGIAPFIPHPKEQMNGWCFTCKEQGMYKKLLSFFGVSEKFFQSQQGSTDYYVRDDSGMIVPAFLEYEYHNDNSAVEKLRSVQRGAMEYINDNKSKDISFSEATKPMLKFGTNPTITQRDMFRFLYNIDGSKIFFLPQTPLLKHSISSIKSELATSPWKVGYMKDLFKLPLPYNTIYSLFKK